MSEEKKTVEDAQQKQMFDERRREFLRTSMYAAYATPLIVSMLVEKASAAASNKNPNCNDPVWAAAHPNVCGPQRQPLFSPLEPKK